ncbi:hypothetical protein [Streptomyces sp. NRRL S-118]|uniref:hypothetical protein n=1 Tax=Streptomyces sp. NRRL S-118 TaxID=1463881 RepID=UPI0004C9AC91|nr:hypothetical protein [Streptomyces sp. NRRL S-118]
MKLRHVRAVAVLGVVLVALTGARGSGGGGCGSSSGSSSNSNSNSDTSSSGGTQGNDGSSGSGTGGASVPGGGSGASAAERDVRIDDCRMDAAGKNLIAKITVTNDDAMDYRYDVTLQFKGDLGGAPVTRAVAKVDDLLVPASQSRTGEASTAYLGDGNGSEYKKCEVINASRVTS